MQFDRTAIRDLAAEVEWAKVTPAHPGVVCGARPVGRPRPGGHRPAGDGAAVRDLRGVQDPARASSTSRTCCSSPRGSSPSGRRSPAPSAASTATSSSTSTRTSTPSSSGSWTSGSAERDDVCVVGDPAQTIYSFTGASPDHLLRFPRRFPTARVVTLVRNYRSTPQVVALANLVSRAASVRTGSAVRAGSPTPAAYVELVAESPAGPSPTLRQHPDDPSEAAAVAADIAGLVREGHPAAEIAVLFRTNAQSEAFEAALSAGRRPLSGPRRRAVLRPPGGPSGRAAAARCGPRRRRLGGPAATRPRHPGRRGVDARAAELRWGGPGAVGVADRPRHPGRRPRRRVAGRPRRRPGPRPRRADRRPARPCGPGRHAGLVPRGQGPRVGHRVPRRLQRRVHPHHAGRGCGGHRGGAAAALRRRHPRPPRPEALLGGGPQPRRPGQPTAVPLPRPGRRRARPGRQGPRERVPAAPGRGTHAQHAGHLPQLRHRAVHRRPAQGGPLRHLPADLRRDARSRRCARGGWPSPGPRRSPHTSSSPTPPSWRSPRPGRAR